MKHKIALAQFEIKLGSPADNIATGFNFIREAVQQCASLIVLPELWTSGYDLVNREKYVPINQEVLDDLHSLASEHNILIGGSFITRNQDAYANTFVLIQPGAVKPIRYHKIHLFRSLDEFEYFQPGSHFSCTDTPIGKVGLAICYDVRFPEMFRAYSRNRVELLLVAAQWGAERSAHWRTLLRARAIENQYFVAAANAVGPLRDKTIAGYSAVIDPWGETLAEADGFEQKLLTAEIDLDTIQAAAARIPSRDDARNDLYPGWQ